MKEEISEREGKASNKSHGTTHFTYAHILIIVVLLFSSIHLPLEHSHILCLL